MVKDGLSVKKIYHKGNWFMPISSSSIYEADYESRILRYSQEIFPGFNCFEFKIDVESPYGTVNPDLVLIHKEYKTWYMAEVELEHHSLRHHVHDQIKKMRFGDYGPKHADRLLSKNPTLDRNRLFELVRQQPEILLIVPFAKDTWINALDRFDTKIASIEMWEDSNGQSLLHLDGALPTDLDDEFISDLVPDPSITRMLRVVNSANIPNEGVLEIEYLGTFSEWSIFTTKTAKFLNPSGRSPLEDVRNRIFSLVQCGENSYRMESRYEV